MAFHEVARPVGRPSRHILEILLAHGHTLITQNRRASVRLHHCLKILTYISAHFYHHIYSQLGNYVSLQEMRVFEKKKGGVKFWKERVKFGGGVVRVLIEILDWENVSKWNGNYMNRGVNQDHPLNIKSIKVIFISQT